MATLRARAAIVIFCACHRYHCICHGCSYRQCYGNITRGNRINSPLLSFAHCEPCVWGWPIINKPCTAVVPHIRNRVCAGILFGCDYTVHGRNGYWKRCCTNSPLHYMPTAIQRAVSFAPHPDAVAAVNELRVIACNDNGFCQYDESSRSTYVATTAKQRTGNVRGNDVA